MTNNKIQSYAERIERVLDEIEGLKDNIKDIYTEVKAADLKTRVLRKAIANKRKKVDAAFEAEVEDYAAALLAMPGATYRGVAEQTGIPRSTLQRRVPKRENGTSESSGGADGTHSGEASGSAEPKSAESSRGLNDDKQVSNPAPLDVPEGAIAERSLVASSPPAPTDEWEDLSRMQDRLTAARIARGIA